MKGLWCFLILVWLCPTYAALPGTVHVYVYHDFPPYVVKSDASSGLSEYFVQKIQHVLPKRPLLLHKTSKPVILEKIAAGDSLMVLWVNPLWFRKYQNKLVYSNPITWDSDHLLSRARSPIKFKGVPSLYGKTLCGLHSHFYKFIDQAIKTRKVSLHQEANIPNCLTAINKGLADFMVIDKSAWLNMLPSTAKKTFYLTSEAVESFSRSALLSKDLSPLLPALNKAIKSLRHSKDWQDKMKSIGGDEFLDLFNLDLFEVIQLDAHH